MEPRNPRTVGAPHYEIKQIFSDGAETAPELLSVLDPPWEARADRRSFLRAGLTAGSVLALLSSCGPPGLKTLLESSPTPTPSEVPTPQPTAPESPGATPSPSAKPTPRPTAKPTPRRTPRPTSHTTCICHGVGTCTCNTVCTCNTICTCIPVCQAHRLLHPDPTVRTMAEEIVLVMGTTEMEYLRWAAETARPDLGARIESMVLGIVEGARPDPTRWPSLAACAEFLDDSDPVVALMSAQMLELHRVWRGVHLDSGLRHRVRQRMAVAPAMRWRPPAT